MDTDLPFGERVAKARGRMSQVTLAGHAGVSESTIKRIEKSGSKSAAQRKGLALVLIEEAGADPALFQEELGQLVEAPSLQQDVGELRRLVGALATLETTKDLPDEARQLLEIELAAARRWSSTGQSFEGPGSEAQSG